MRARGGAEAYAGAIAARLQDLGHSVGRLDITGHVGGDGAHSRPALFGLAGLPGLRDRVLWKYALVCRAVPAIARAYDYVVFGFGEGPGLSCPALHIRHAPALFSTRPALLSVLGARRAGLPLRGIYTRLCRLVAGFDPDLAANPGTTVIANTGWTAGMVRAQCGIAVDGVLYPKVVPFARPARACLRDPFRMLALGRITRNKRLEEAVALLERLRADGVPATLEIVGRANTPYARWFLRRYRNHPHIDLSPDAGRDALARALARARTDMRIAAE
jgi:glycosyltransferase involved in cell wall biosynthesis